MMYIALLRGINVGGNKKVDMKKLTNVLETLGYTDIVTYLNSGNVLFESRKKQATVQKEIPKKLEEAFGFEIQTLVKTSHEIDNIAKAIPKKWENNAEQKTDIAYLFPDIDRKSIIDELPIQKENIEIKYVNGALIWHVLKKDYNKSQLNKIIATKLYKSMTIRNVNTARRLVELSHKI